jgi:hypothetical protein
MPEVNKKFYGGKKMDEKLLEQISKLTAELDWELGKLLPIATEGGSAPPKTVFALKEISNELRCKVHALHETSKLSA